MATPDDQAALELDDAENNRIHAVWSRSGKHLIVSVASAGNWQSASQVTLTRDQVARLRDFLAEDARPGRTAGPRSSNRRRL
jgi:hypothetical protein